MRIAAALLVAILVVLVGCSTPSSTPAATTAPSKPAPATPAAAAPAAAPTAAQTAGWAPQKAIEFVVQSGAGGGSDIFARSIADTLAKEKLIAQPIVVSNKAGAAGAEAFEYVGSKKGDPHVWLNDVSTLITTPLTAQSKYNYKDFGYVGIVSFDEFLLLVKGDSPIKDTKELVDKAKQKPEDIKAGGGYPGSADSICTALLEKATGAKFTFVPFKSGGEAVAAMLGGHVDFVWANPGEGLELMQAKKARVLAMAGGKRMALLPDVPTLKEQGYDVVYQQFRGVAIPSGVAKEAVSFYEAALKKMTDSDTWKNGYLKNNMATGTFMDSVAATKYMEEQNAMYVKILKDLAVIK